MAKVKFLKKNSPNVFCENTKANNMFTTPTSLNNKPLTMPCLADLRTNHRDQPRAGKPEVNTISIILPPLFIQNITFKNDDTRSFMQWKCSFVPKIRDLRVKKMFFFCLIKINSFTAQMLGALALFIVLLSYKNSW